MAKNFNPGSIVFGDRSTLTVTFSNSQVNPAQLTADFVDTFPANLVIANPANATSNCLNAVGSATPGGNTVTLTDNGGGSPAAIPASGSCSLSVQVTAAIPPPPASYTNTINVGDLKTNLGSNTAGASATLNVTSSPPTVSKQFNPGSVVLGEASTLTITLQNTDHIDATLTADLIDTFPAGLEAANPTNASTNCPGGVVTATPGGDSVTLGTGAKIPQQGQCALSVQVTAQGPGAFTNTINAGDLQTDIGNNPADASDTLNVTSVPPTVAKAFNPTTINLASNSRSTLTITLNNSDHKDATLTADLVDTLPGHVIVASPANATTNCDGGTVNATPGANTVTLANGSQIPQQGQCAVSVQVTADAPGTFVNKIGIGSLQTDIGANLNSASASLTANAVPPTLAKAFAPASITAGTNSLLTITLTNANAATAALATPITDAFPPGLKVSNPPSAGSTCFGGAVTANAGGTTASLAAGAQIPPNGSCAISVSVTAATAATYTNTLGVGALQTSLGSNSASASANLVVNAATGNPIAPTIGANFSPANIAPGTVSRLSIALYNANATVASVNSVFTAMLPPGVTLATPANAATTCTNGVVSTPNSSTVSLASGAKIPADSACTIAASVTASTPGSYTFTIPASSLSTNDGTNAASVTVRLQVEIPPDLIFASGFDPPPP